MRTLVISCFDSGISWIIWKFYKARIFCTLLFSNKVLFSLVRHILNRNACFEDTDGFLRFFSKSIFGPAHTRISIPRDNVIYAAFLKNGYWSLPTSFFMFQRMKRVKDPLILDLGAHVGLVSLQTLKLNFDIGRVIAVEALPNHFQALSENFESLNLTSYCGALVSDTSVTSVKMSVDSKNFGNSSLLSEIVSKDLGGTYQVEVPVIPQSLVTTAINGSKFILKTDLQGYDVAVLSSFGDDFWRNCSGGVIEVNAHSQIVHQQVNVLLERLAGYRHISWTPFFIRRISVSEVYDFWTSGNKHERDLYFW
jgi:FkbM family methyltransferase